MRYLYVVAAQELITEVPSAGTVWFVIDTQSQNRAIARCASQSDAITIVTALN